ncbi:imidazole glycerol phosphate synthase subunit HisH [Candidatus Thioglobus autotrophicus]|uniref:imidazole glycerol phosphate synthase subunit HisH n=1 Tax=Candidatus Thioglobus autotrophicus TaxID=1705394 RepID=UPI0009E90C9F|nr:imidazole glycerol phosphate synthase subunit HisH [Candidatus Thioglobus autotrophicus]
MSNIIGIVNYGIAGNIHSIKKAVERAGGNTLVINKPSDFSLVDKLIIPGVGSFKDGMQELENDNFINPIQEFSKPILGICLGMQIMADLGFEFGKTKGLGLISAEVKLILCDGKIPHVGFNKINVKNPNVLLDGVENEEFYFMHSYEMVNYTDITALTKYNNHSFVSAIHKGSIYGVQFHPEKSREAGIRLLSNFIKL